MNSCVQHLFFDSCGTHAYIYIYIYILNSTDTSKQKFLELRESYIDFLIDHLQERLCNSSTEVLDTFSLLEPNVAVSITPEEIVRLYMCYILASKSALAIQTPSKTERPRSST